MQHLVLEALWYQDGMTATELSRLLLLDKATLSGVLERMAETGWIVKTPDPDDRRVQRLHPSRKANEFKEELIRQRRASNQEILEGFTSEERILLKRLLHDII